MIFTEEAQQSSTKLRTKSVVTSSGNSGHVVVPKVWIGKEASVILKESKAKRSNELY